MGGQSSRLGTRFTDSRMQGPLVRDSFKVEEIGRGRINLGLNKILEYGTNTSNIHAMHR